MLNIAKHSYTMLTPKQNAMIFIISKGSTNKKSSPSWVMLSVLLFLMPVSKSKVAYHLGGDLGSWWKLGKPDISDLYEICRHMTRDAIFRKTRVPSKIHGGWKKPSGQQLWKILKSSVSFQKKTHPHPQHQTLHNFIQNSFVGWFIVT